MKIKINKITKKISTVWEVPYGDLFIRLEDGEVYVRTYEGCFSLRDGKKHVMPHETKVRFVHSITIEADGFPK